MVTREQIRMTTLASCAGCAAKLGPESLTRVLRPLTRHTDPRLLVGLQTSDDAAVYQISETQAVIQTVDFFTPIVDDPWTFGAIAAANSMSDVYAMGGDVLFTLNVAAFPADFPEDVITTIFEGGASKVVEAGAVVAGGHTITTLEPLYGMSVTGQVHPKRIWTKAGAQTGDVLFLTKAIGTGVITSSLKNQTVGQESLDIAVASMLMLNQQAALFARDFTVNACTDITGYGLTGHSYEMASKSSVRIELSASAVPVLDGAMAAVEAEQVPGGLIRNRRYFQSQGVRIGDDVDRTLATLLFDPQTSGGLLFSIPAAEADEFEHAAASQALTAWRIGRVTPGDGIDVVP